MIYSPCRAADEKWRLELLEQMLDDFSNNRPLTAKAIGQMTRVLDERIRTHDYSREDAWHYKEKQREPIKHEQEETKHYGSSDEEVVRYFKDFLESHPLPA